MNTILPRFGAFRMLRLRHGTTHARGMGLQVNDPLDAGADRVGPMELQRGPAQGAEGCSRGLSRELSMIEAKGVMTHAGSA